MAATPSASLTVGIAVDHDHMPDCGSLAQRGVKAYRFLLRWSRMVTSTTFYHDRPAVAFDSGTAPHDAQRSRDGHTAGDDMAFWPHDDPRWHPIHADAWAGLPTAEVVVDLDAVHHYRVLMTALRAHGVEPVPLLDPCDMPPVLRGVIGGWGSPLAIEAYAQFARVAFMQLGHLADLWLGLVLAAEPLVRGPYAHRAARHMALGHARAASIYHRDLAGAAGVARGRFGAIVECGPMACDERPSTETDGQANLDRLLRMFKAPSTAAAPSTMDDHADDGNDNGINDDNNEDDNGGFAWGFTTSQKMVLSRSADVIVLECAPAGHDDQQPVPCDADRDGASSAPRDMALAIDCAVAALPGAALVVCDGPAHGDLPYGSPHGDDGTGQDMGDSTGQISDRDPLMTDHRVGQDSCRMHEDGHGDDEDDDGDVDAIDVCVDGDGAADAGGPVGYGLNGGQWDERTAACLLERFGDVRSAVSMGRPVSAYLLRPARSHAPASPRADPFCL